MPSFIKTVLIRALALPPLSLHRKSPLSHF